MSQLLALAQAQNPVVQHMADPSALETLRQMVQGQTDKMDELDASQKNLPSQVEAIMQKSNSAIEEALNLQKETLSMQTKSINTCEELVSKLIVHTNSLEKYHDLELKNSELSARLAMLTEIELQKDKKQKKLVKKNKLLELEIARLQIQIHEQQQKLESFEPTEDAQNSDSDDVDMVTQTANAGEDDIDIVAEHVTSTSIVAPNSITHGSS